MSHSQAEREHKKCLRAVMKQRRNALGSEQKAAASAVINECLLHLWEEFRSPSPVAVYLATPEEASLDEFIRALLKCNTSAFAPRGEAEQDAPFSSLRSLEETIVGSFGARETLLFEDAKFLSPDEMKWIMVPGLAFDGAGNRLGQGGGWYDRVLSRLDSTQHTGVIGVCFECQLLEAVPHQAHDQKVTMIVTESRVLRPARFQD